jgi:ATP-binding cassette subfamily B protein
LIDRLRNLPLFRDARLSLARLLPRVDPLLSALLAVAIALGTLLGVGFMLASGALVGTVPAVLREGRLDSPAGQRLAVAAAAVVAVFIVREVVGPVRDALTRTLGRRLEEHLRERAMGAALGPAGIAHLEDPALLDLVSRARGAAMGQYPPRMALQGLVDLVEARLQVISSFVLVAAFFRWWLALGLLAVFLFVRSRARRLDLQVMEVLTRTTGALRRSDYFLGLALRPDAAKETRVFGLAGWVVERFRSSWLGTMERIRAQRRAGIRAAGPWLVVIVFLAELTAFAVVGYAAATGEIGLAALAIVGQAIMGLTAGIFGVSHTESWLEHGATSVPAVLELAEKASQRRMGSICDAAGLPGQEVRFEGVRFSYPGAREPVFDGLDLAIPPDARSP